MSKSAADGDTAPLSAIAETVAELTSRQDGVIRQQLIEQLTREIMNYDAEYRREDAAGGIGVSRAAEATSRARLDRGVRLCCACQCFRVARQEAVTPRRARPHPHAGQAGGSFWAPLSSQKVVRRISENDASNGVLALESNGVLHGVKLLNSPQQRHDEIRGSSIPFRCHLLPLSNFLRVFQYLSHRIRVAREVINFAPKISRISLFRIRRQQEDLPNAAFLP